MKSTTAKTKYSRNPPQESSRAGDGEKACFLRYRKRDPKAEETRMDEKSPQSMLKWISRTYDLSPTALARMFQRNARTISVWMKEGRIPETNGNKIRSAFYYLNNSPDPHDPRRSGIDMI